MEPVDTEKYGEQYKNFYYDVTKCYENIDIETELSDDAEEEDDEIPEPTDEEAPELPTIRVVRITVVIYFPKEPGKDEHKTMTVETYIRPPSYGSGEGTESTEGTGGG